MTTEQILEKLRNPGTKVPREELDEVVRRREEFVPLLTSEIEKTIRLGAAADLDDSLPWFALYLFAQLREERALEPIMELFALDGKTTDVYGDLITGSGSRILAAVGHDNPGTLREYAKRKDISRWVRWATLDALVLQALWGEQPRESVVRFLSELIETNEFGDDEEAWTCVVCACSDFHPREFLDGIRGLYERDLVEIEMLGTFKDLQKEAREDPEAHHRRHADVRPPITDTADEVSSWQLFREPQIVRRDLEANVPTPTPPAPATPAAPTTPIRGAPKTGRNDPCPCGSGKKFKKCCLAVA